MRKENLQFAVTCRQMQSERIKIPNYATDKKSFSSKTYDDILITKLKKLEWY